MINVQLSIKVSIFASLAIILHCCTQKKPNQHQPVSKKSNQSKTSDYYHEKRVPKPGDTLILFNHQTNYLKRKYGCDTCECVVLDFFFRKEFGGHFFIEPLFIPEPRGYYSLSEYYINSKEGYKKSTLWKWRDYPVEKGNQIDFDNPPNGDCMTCTCQQLVEGKDTCTDIIFKIK
ncbi:MAG TPA: hypothetical protein VK177_11495 [Flavobacteriales bacterium]|nr:hypothetical protein [Flavobacteriales bacterium]